MTETFSKTVAIKAVDDDEMTATGVVMTPYELDRQLDWLDPDGIKAMFNDSPSDGVMHTSFPDGHASLEFNKVLDEPTTIDGVEFEAGEWVIRRRYENDRRWQLVKDGILSAYSIGGKVTAVEEYDSIDALPDEVDVSKVDPDAVGEQYWPPSKLVDGEVAEISDVDIGAVPSADMAVVKAAGSREKNLFEQADGRQEFIEMMKPRGHEADEAARLWRYLQRTKAANEPAESGVGSDTTDDMTTDDTDDGQTAKAAAEDSDFESGGVAIKDTDDATLGARIKSALGFGSEADDDTSSEDSDAAKAGQTLSQTNRRAVMASIDAQIGMLDDAGVDHGMTRFTDRSDFAFDLGEYEAGWDEEKADNNAPGGDTPDDDMSNDNTEKSEPPEWAASLTDKVEQIDKRVSEMEDGEDAEKSLDDAPEWAQELAEKVDGLDERVDKVSKATADTQQAGGAEKTGDSDEDLTKTEKQKRELFGITGGN